ncbi:MAG: hypothetical protein IPN71_16715 [Fibrobacteres bacterium]|nr:hypothetical protein [Fibrobacterota bacterium]
MKAIGLIAILALSCSAYPTDELAVLYPMPIGYQCEYSVSNASFKSSIDASFDLTFVSIGANINQDLSPKLFIGGGFGGLGQFQYGYDFAESDNIFRIRADYPFYLNKFWVPHFLRWLCVGPLYEYEFRKNGGHEIGITIGINAQPHLLE